MTPTYKWLVSAALIFAILPGRAALAAEDAPLVASDRATAARETVDHVFPIGTYQRMMKASMDVVKNTVLDSVRRMPVRQLAAIGGATEEELATMGEGSLSEALAILDPAFDERMAISTNVILTEMTDMMVLFEPALRDGLAEAYADRFTAVELRELNKFFATPTGTAYASEAFMIFLDPKVMSRMEAIMPKIMERMPAIMKNVSAAVDNLPHARTYEDLSDAEKRRLDEILGAADMPAHGDN